MGALIGGLIVIVILMMLGRPFLGGVEGVEGVKVAFWSIWDASVWPVTVVAIWLGVLLGGLAAVARMSK
jgi:hypothetical protein